VQQQRTEMKSSKKKRNSGTPIESAVREVPETKIQKSKASHTTVPDTKSITKQGIT
jgi:hypothetical protein